MGGLIAVLLLEAVEDFRLADGLLFLLEGKKSQFKTLFHLPRIFLENNIDVMRLCMTAGHFHTHKHTLKPYLRP